ncbi:HAD family hydrolase [Microbulbifer spongiae]|uniref:HAD hydrolase-like protein n=1 Tax=Microbulbifer spongiae TaxID=2944933 RepID=A0ABY9EAK4_9GAMM|nr:HAD family hydrolase [Microbulbifer sp. MI-G]WKD50053.1 HAD hydrolase-like protein [Microbulbifer sp. MI-G]
MPKAYLFDWGDTLMVDFPGIPGKMCNWKYVEAVTGAKELLQSLSESAEIYVATGADESSPSEIEAAFSRCGLSQFIKGYFCKSNLGISKGSGQFFSAILSKLDMPPSEATVVGDSFEKDIKPAVAAGMDAVWLTTETCEAPNGVRKIHQLSELCT